MARDIPKLNQLRDYAVNRAGIEGIRQSLYDHELYLAAGQTQLLMFTKPKGQGVTTSPGATVGTVKSISDTNMDVAGMLPAGKSFLAESIEVSYRSGTSSAANTFALANPSLFAAAAAASVAAQLADVNQFYNSGSLKLYVGSKAYLEEAPLGRFPPKTNVRLDAAVASNSATVGEVAIANGIATGRPYVLEPAILLENNQNFQVELNWVAALATVSTFNSRVGVILDGYLYRNSQ